MSSRPQPGRGEVPGSPSVPRGGSAGVRSPGALSPLPSRDSTVNTAQ